MKNTLREINKQVLEDPQGFVQRAEAEYINSIYSIAQRVAEDDEIKIVAIAGPSASGKTTTGHILQDRLHTLGETTVLVSLDDFYLPVDQLPILPDGRVDIESVNSLDISLIQKCFNEIIKDGRTHLPRFDFMQKQRVLAAREVNVQNHGIVIVEGLHALNPLITGLVPRNNIFKIYISVNCEILDENGQKLLSSRQMRLVRRALRDEVFRNTGINNTLELWEGVVSGEEKYLYCFKDTADVQLKTLHLFEPSLYRDRFLAMKAQVDPLLRYYKYFMRTAEAISKFEPISATYVSHDSLIREFIGDGKYN